MPKGREKKRNAPLLTIYLIRSLFNIAFALCNFFILFNFFIIFNVSMINVFPVNLMQPFSLKSIKNQNTKTETYKLTYQSTNRPAWKVDGNWNTQMIAKHTIHRTDML